MDKAVLRKKQRVGLINYLIVLKRKSCDLQRLCNSYVNENRESPEFLFVIKISLTTLLKQLSQAHPVFCDREKEKVMHSGLDKLKNVLVILLNPSHHDSEVISIFDGAKKPTIQKVRVFLNSIFAFVESVSDCIGVSQKMKNHIVKKFREEEYIGFASYMEALIIAYFSTYDI